MLRYEATQGKDKPVHREDSPRAVHREDSPRAVHREDSPRAVHREDSPRAVHREDSPRAVHREDSPRAVHREDSPRAVHREDSPRAVHREDSPRAASIYFGCGQPTLQEACVIHNASFRSVVYAVISVFFQMPFLRPILAESSCRCDRMWKPTYAFYFPAEQFASDGFGCKASEVRGILMVSEDFS